MTDRQEMASRVQAFQPQGLVLASMGAPHHQRRAMAERGLRPERAVLAIQAQEQVSLRVQEQVSQRVLARLAQHRHRSCWGDLGPKGSPELHLQAHPTRWPMRQAHEPLR